MKVRRLAGSVVAKRGSRPEKRSSHRAALLAGVISTTSLHAATSAAQSSIDFPNGPFSPPALTALKINTFSARQMFFGGVTQQIGFATHLSANVWRTIQTGKTQPGDGNATQFQLLADYNWSKRTDTYLEVDYSQYRGGLVGAQLQGVNGISSAFGTTQLGVSAGLRHLF